MIDALLRPVSSLLWNIGNHFYLKRAHRNLQYKVYKDGSWYCAEFPRLGIASQGETRESAKKNLRDALLFNLETLMSKEYEQYYLIT